MDNQLRKQEIKRRLENLRADKKNCSPQERLVSSQKKTNHVVNCVLFMRQLLSKIERFLTKKENETIGEQKHGKSRASRKL